MATNVLYLYTPQLCREGPHTLVEFLLAGETWQLSTHQSTHRLSVWCNLASVWCEGGHCCHTNWRCGDRGKALSLLNTVVWGWERTQDHSATVWQLFLLAAGSRLKVCSEQEVGKTPQRNMFAEMWAGVCRLVQCKPWPLHRYQCH